MHILRKQSSCTQHGFRQVKLTFWSRKQTNLFGSRRGQTSDKTFRQDARGQWKDQSLTSVRPKEYYATNTQRVERIDITPTAGAPHAPGQNPNGEDMSQWMLQGMAGLMG
ncbi:hypothetical protein FOZ60_013470 [Perkinsus olseni]|uniref:Uncharacterized protein n=1 Tax=Perkinsus olseni TaxID=32597 RepID=A0A7J6N9G5_PEROL|nr:hypothetical protein FOZ60_013470 [Perkinsus olseni]